MSTDESEQTEITTGTCNHCGGERNCFVRASHTRHDSVDIGEYWTAYDVIECCGCGQLMVRRTDGGSEWATLRISPESGAGSALDEQVTYYPPAIFRRKPAWHCQIGDQVLEHLLDEIYAALHNNCQVLALVGIRTLLDRVMFLKVGDVGGFARKFEAMASKGIVGKEELSLLKALTEAGHAASHRAYVPTMHDLLTVLDIIENLIQRLFVLGDEARRVKDATPARTQKLRVQ